MKLKKKIKVDVTPKECAVLFASMPSMDQAEFFNEVAEYVKNNYTKCFCFQLQWITDDKTLTDDGREIMSLIGDYS